MPRVLSTDTAKSAISTMSSIINGGLTDQISQLDQQGRQLSQPDVWDGSLAAQFRCTWPETSRSLQTVKADLDDLRMRIERINADIMTAGGN
jgi:uncharacterized protein YukE